MARNHDPDPYEQYADMWMLSFSNTLTLIENLPNMHLLDAVLFGEFGMLTTKDSKQSLMYTMYPCGLVFVGELDESKEFDSEFAQRPNHVVTLTCSRPSTPLLEEAHQGV